jgi:hypothetical protein
MHRLRLAAALLAVLALVGCTLPKVPYERSSAQVKTIGVVTPGFPDGAVVFRASSVGHSFGLVGGLIEAGLQAARESQFKTVLEQQKFSVESQFLAGLTEALQARGYEVAAVPWSRSSGSYLERYPTTAPPKVDAYLDVVTRAYGYVSAGMGDSTPYRPYYEVRVRLVSAKGAVLMEDMVIYNPVLPGGVTSQAITVPPEPSHRFNDFEALVGNPSGAVKALAVATRQSAETIAKLLQ